jgi:hypothetical protein
MSPSHEVQLSDEWVAIKQIVDEWVLQNEGLLKAQRQVLLHQRRLAALSASADKIISAKTRGKRSYSLTDLL